MIHHHHTRLRRRRPALALFALALCTVLLPALPTAPAVAAPAAATTAAEPPPADACTADESHTKPGAPFLLPAWSDGSGWSRPEQYETIASGDVDGDDKGELVGRSGSHIEVYTWATGVPEPTAPPRVPKAYNPSPGQWTQMIPRGAPPAFRTEDGWWDPSRYATFQLADVDGQRGDELIARNSAGIEIYRWDKVRRTFGPAVKTTALSDAAGFGQSYPTRYRSIQTGQLNSAPGDEIIGLGPTGIQVWTFHDGTLQPLSNGAPILDAAEWQQERYASTIRLGDFDHNGVDELVALYDDGVHHFVRDVASGTWTESAARLTDWNQTAGWDQPTQYRTIAVADVDGDGADELVGRSGKGIDARRWTTGGWAPVAGPNGFSDAEGWNYPENAFTVQPADVLAHKGVEMIGRADGGVVTYALVNGAWTTYDTLVIPQFSNANGWGAYTAPAGSPSEVPAGYRFSTIQPATVLPGQQVVIGRDATGVRTFHADGTTPTAPFPAWASRSAPPGLAPLDAARARAFKYINDAAGGEYLMGSDFDLLQGFRDTNFYPHLGPLQGELFEAIKHTDTSPSGYDPGNKNLSAMNVSRDQYNSVVQDVSDWIVDVQNVHTHLLDDQGLTGLTKESFLKYLGDVDTIKAAFDSNAALWAFIGDLIWGVIGAISILTGQPELDAAFAAAMSIAGAAIGGALSFVDPNGAINTEAGDLKSKLRSALCSSLRFYANSYDQIVGDLGLLTASSQMLTQTFATAPQFEDQSSAMVKGQDLWIWQQFGNMDSGSNLWVGWCDFAAAGVDCAWSENDPNTWSPPENSRVSYRLIGELVGSQGTDGHCGYDVLGDSANSGLRALLDPGGTNKPDLAAVAAPRQTDNAGKGRPYPDPPHHIIEKNIGIQGWRLGTKQCDYPWL